MFADYVWIFVFVFITVMYLIHYSSQTSQRRGYEIGCRMYRYGTQLQALRISRNLTIEQVSKNTDLDARLINWVEAGSYEDLKGYDYFQITDILFNYYGIAKTDCCTLSEKNKSCGKFYKKEFIKSPLMKIKEPKKE